MCIIYCTMFFPCDRVLLHHLPLLQIPDGFRSSDAGCQSTLQCVQRKFPVAVSAVQQFKILGIRAAKPPVLVHHISGAGLCLFHAVPVQDVEKAKGELQNIIGEITEEMTKIFAEQFKLLSESFQTTAGTLSLASCSMVA